MTKINKSDSQWKDELTEEQFRVCREKGTEAPFTGQYYNHKAVGVYKCVCCGNVLFESKAKYDSGSGWPSFCQPIDDSSVKTETDTSHGMIRTEILCQKCGAHLGHEFPDGPQPTGLRYCINSVALDFDQDDS